MNVVGIIAEYNPFHNGHVFHLKKIKELYPDSLIVLVMSSSFTERGEISILNKWEKTALALKYGVDLVVELPFVYSTQSADIFAKTSITLLNNLGATHLVFGSECNDINKLQRFADTQINNKDYDNLVKSYLDTGINYPTALSKALEDITGDKIVEPNDLLGISYIKSIIELKSNIQPITISRTNNYHESATNIRNSLINKKNIKDNVPIESYNLLKNKDLSKFKENIFKLLKYKIDSVNNLDEFATVDEGIDNRIKKMIDSSSNYDELVENIKTKRYTYNKINRMLIHILCNLTKDMLINNIDIKYIRILGFSDDGQQYLNKIKKKVKLPLVTTYSKFNDDVLDFELTVTKIYSSIIEDNSLTKLEYSMQPIKRSN